MAAHAAFSLATDVGTVYFAHPHSPWGTPPPTNGLLREYFPKGTEITDDQTYLSHCVAAELNNRPRRYLLGSPNPSRRFADLLTSSIASTD